MMGDAYTIAGIASSRRCAGAGGSYAYQWQYQLSGSTEYWDNNGMQADKNCWKQVRQSLKSSAK